MKLLKEIKIIKYYKSYIRDIFNLKLTGFETYEQFFNGEYTREEKEKYKNHIFNIMNNESWDKQ